MGGEATPLSGKTALVTGGAKRIGRSVALALAAEGASVVIHYGSSESEVRDVAASVREHGVNAWTVRADLADPAAAENLFPDAQRLAGPIDIVVNNASIFPENTLADMTPADVALNMQVNALAPFVIGRAFAAQGRPGCIVNFLDTRILHYDRKHTAYHLSKRTLFTLTRMMALEFAPRVRVNAVAPGLVLPPPGEDEAYLQRLAPRIPLQKVGSLQAVTDAALFLIRSDFVTGQVIFVDGGFHMTGCVYGR